MNTVSRILFGGRRSWWLASFLLCLLLVTAAPGIAQETATQPATNAETVEQPADSTTTQASSRSLNEAQTLTLVFAYSLLGLTVVFALASLMRIWTYKEWPEIESHWGGLGGGLGGVRVSPSLLFLAAAIAFAGLLSGLQDDVASALEARDEPFQQGAQGGSESVQQEPEAEDQAEDPPVESIASAGNTNSEAATAAEDDR